MRNLRYFTFITDGDFFPEEYVYKNVENVARSKFSTSIMGDFRWLSEFFARHLELRLRSYKFKSSFQSIFIVLSKEYQIDNSIEGSLCVKIPFDFEKFRELYPIPNLYPMKYEFNKFIHPIKDVNIFNNFLLEITLDAFEYVKEQKLEFPFELIKTDLETFKKNNFKREWYFKKKTFKEKGITARLFCKKTCNEFTLELIILKGRTEKFRKQIGRTNPSYISYRLLNGELELCENILLVTKPYQECLPIKEKELIFSKDLRELGIKYSLLHQFVNRCASFD